MEFNNSYQLLGEQFSTEVNIQSLTKPDLLLQSEQSFQLIGHSLNSETLKWFNGEIRFLGDQRRSHVYAGHQFGVWAGQLGDGRAISLGEILNSQGERWEVQLKGSGKTPFSRFGDGKAVIRSCIREFLASENLAALGIPTTRALAVLTGDHLVQRESLEREAICVRLLQSNVRFGTFEWFASQGDQESFDKLTDYCKSVLFQKSEMSNVELFAEIVKRTAILVSHWQSLGFCHGVMNTDNMSILGVTLDFGPFGFLENFDPEYICNHSDHQGRYRYSMQPKVAHWNLNRLAAVFEYFDESSDFKTPLLEFSNFFQSHYRHLMTQKLGLENTLESDATIAQFLQILNSHQLDFTESFYSLSTNEWEKLPGLDWVKSYSKLRRFNPKNPIYVLKNYVAERAIRAYEDHGDQTLLQSVFEVVQNPFDKRNDFDWWASSAPPEERCLSVSCSS